MPEVLSESILAHEVAQLEQWLREHTATEGNLRFEIQRKLESKQNQLNKIKNDDNRITNY